MIRQLLRGFLSLVPRPTEEWDFEERRKLIRLRCHYKCAMQSEGKKFDGIVLDMGVGGLRLRTFHGIKVGHKVLVHSPFHEVGEAGEPVECTVQWVHKPDRNLLTYAGCKYSSEGREMSKSWVKNVLKQLGFRPEFIRSKRKHVRAECFVEGSLRRSDNARQEVRLHNVGVGGLLFEYRGVLPTGELQQVRIGPFEKLPGLDVTGKIVKARPEGKHFLYSLEFEELKPAQLRLLTVYLKTLMRNTWES